MKKEGWQQGLSAFSFLTYPSKFVEKSK